LQVFSHMGNWDLIIKEIKSEGDNYERETLCRGTSNRKLMTGQGNVWEWEVNMINVYTLYIHCMNCTMYIHCIYIVLNVQCIYMYENRIMKPFKIAKMWGG
jgi:phage shock protein PspC (stress-responsive transcriptional regulator)